MVRVSLEEQREKLAKQKAQIEARLKQLDARAKTEARKLDTRRKVIVGALVLGAAEARAAHREWLLQILKAAHTRDQDRAVITGLIAELEAEDDSAAEPLADLEIGR